MTWHAKRVRWWWQRKTRGGGGGEGGLLSPAGFILTSFPGASHTSWNSLNYAPSMAQRSKWHSKKYCVTGCVLWRSYFIIHHPTSDRPGQNVCNEYIRNYFVFCSQINYTVGSLCVEFARSPCACVDFLRVLRLRLIDGSKLPVGVNVSGGIGSRSATSTRNRLKDKHYR